MEELGFSKPRFKLCERAQALCNFWKDCWLEIRKKMLTERASGCPSCKTCFTIVQFSTLSLPPSSPLHRPLLSFCPSNLWGKKLSNSWEIFYSCAHNNIVRNRGLPYFLNNISIKIFWHSGFNKKKYNIQIDVVTT